jgi:hypothetical protein
MTTIWQQESPTQTDKWNLLVNAWDVLADNNWDTIVFNNGIFYDSNTEWEEDNTF